MPIQEFYIREATETDSRGPFTLDQLLSLVENGQASRETLYYDMTTDPEQWVAIGDNAELVEALYPKKTTLRVRRKEAIQSINQAHEEESRPITVNEMLAAAEGLTEETRGRVNKEAVARRAANFARYGAIVLLLITAIAYLVPSFAKVTSLDWLGMLDEPLAYVGLLDAFLVLVLLLGATSFYSLVRFRAIIVFGYVGLIAYLGGDTLQIAAVLAASLGLYLCTLARSMATTIVASAIGLIGVVVLALHAFSSPL